jgi:hypothetical protein
MNSQQKLDDYQLCIRALSDRIVEAQTPIRVLDAVKWDDGIRDGFLKAKGKQPPAVNRDYYLSRPLAFDAAAKKLEFQNIERDITRQLGQFNPVGQIMRRMCKEYRMVIRMLEARGTEDFGLISQELYGAASDAFHAGDPTLADLGLMLSDYLNNIAARGDLEDEAKTLGASDAVNILQQRLAGVFGDVELTGIAVTRHAGNAATARAELSVEIDDDSVVVFAYTVQLVEREGRWEVTDVGGAPPVSELVDDPDDEPSVPPAPAATGVTPSPTSPVVTGGGSSSPTTNP